MRKNFYLSGLFLCILALCVCGCGGGGSAADPMGTGTVQFVDGSGSVIDTATVVPNGTITLRAKVTNLRSDGTSVPVVNEEVYFSIVNTGNGGSLTVLNTRTSGSGTATALFTSGNSMYSDIVQVTTEGSKSTATIHINKTGGMTTPRIDTLTASTPTVVAGQTSVITAHVVDGSSSPVMGVLVRFRLPVNGSGASFSDAYADDNFYAYTDVGGNATAVYKAGGVDPYSVVYDTVQAELENGSSKAVEIKRTAGTAPPPSGLTLTTNPSPPSVAAGQTIIITATITGDDKAYAAVIFTIPVNASGASFINAGGSHVSAITVIANGSGIATALYQAGSTSPGTAVQDTVQAVLANGSNAAVIITRTSTTPSTYTVAIAASSTSVTAGQVSIITATVTVSGTTPGPAAGVPVVFTLPVKGSGVPTLTPTTATTDGSGKAVVIYQPGTTSPTLTVQDTVQAAVGTATNSVVITRTGSTASAYSITVTALPTTLALVDSNSVITANVKNNAGTVVSGVTVDFVVTGTAAPALLGTLSPASATTDGSGNAVTTFTGGGAGRLTDQTDVVTATVRGTTYTAAVIITYP
ncbi:MAG: hypothetical protein NTZ12_00400 [Candidatus Aminicenantes bacterium]|nr:hypothetical protein [Candidatus Aminicenantes bacterium]